MFTIKYAPSVEVDLIEARPHDRVRLLNRIEEQLTHQPAQVTRNKKMLMGLVPPWEYVPPVWELRCGKHRVFYDVDEEQQLVVVRAIRLKPFHTTTEDIL